jgi:hypothetical protein
MKVAFVERLLQWDDFIEPSRSWHPTERRVSPEWWSDRPRDGRCFLRRLSCEDRSLAFPCRRFSPRQCRRLGWFSHLNKETDSNEKIGTLCRRRYELAPEELIVDAIDAACRYVIILDYGSQGGYSTLVSVFSFSFSLSLSLSLRFQWFLCPSISLDGDRHSLPASSRACAPISTRDATRSDVEGMDKLIVLAASSSTDM